MQKHKHTIIKHSLMIGITLFLSTIIPAHAAYQYKLNLWNYTNEKILYTVSSQGCSDVKEANKRTLIQAGKSRTILFNRADRCSGKQGQVKVEVQYWNNTPGGGQPFFDGSGAFFFDFSNSGGIALLSKIKQKRFNYRFSAKKPAGKEETCEFDTGCTGEGGELMLRLYHKAN